MSRLNGQIAAGRARLYVLGLSESFHEQTWSLNILLKPEQDNRYTENKLNEALLKLRVCFCLRGGKKVSLEK